jgi:hypothetical protein
MRTTQALIWMVPGSKVVVLKVICGNTRTSQRLIWMVPGSNIVILKGSVVSLSPFIKYRTVVSITVSYSGRLGFEHLSTGDCSDEVFGDFLQYARQTLRVSFNKPRPIPSASFYFIIHLVMRHRTCITYSVDKASWKNHETRKLSSSRWTLGQTYKLVATAVINVFKIRNNLRDGYALCVYLQEEEFFPSPYVHHMRYSDTFIELTSNAA